MNALSLPCSANRPEINPGDPLNTAIIIAITRGQVADYVNALVWIYTFLILIRILLTWVPNLPDYPGLRPAVRFVEDVTEPYLAIWRRMLPTINFAGGGIDISPILAVFALQLVGGIAVSAIAG